MNRQILRELLAWKNDPARKPLILKGVRQSGKTWTLRQFGKEHFSDTAHFNFAGNTALRSVFAEDLNPERICTELGLLRGRTICPGTTLLIFDEIQFCPAALSSLQYFAENLPALHVICAGSLPGIALAGTLSIPVGKVNFLTLYPMNFSEFLLANGKDLLVSHLQTLHAADTVPDSILPELRTLYREYLITGGMPEAVLTWIQTHDAGRVEEVHRQILQSYVLDFTKHAPLKDLPKRTLIRDAVPQRLAKDIGKFVFSRGKTGGRTKDLEDALQWLADAGFVHMVEMVDCPDIPLPVCGDVTYFKLYLADVGLLRTLVRFPVEALTAPSPRTSDMLGTLMENYVVTELIAQGAERIGFQRSGSCAEVDFVVQEAAEIVPVAVTAAESLVRYRELYAPAVSVRMGLAGLRLQEDESGSVLELPLMLVWRMREIVQELISTRPF